MNTEEERGEIVGSASSLPSAGGAPHVTFDQVPERHYSASEEREKLDVGDVLNGSLGFRSPELPRLLHLVLYAACLGK